MKLLWFCDGCESNGRPVQYSHAYWRWECSAREHVSHLDKNENGCTIAISSFSPEALSILRRYEGHNVPIDELIKVLKPTLDDIVNVILKVPVKPSLNNTLRDVLTEIQQRKGTLFCYDDFALGCFNPC